MPEINNWSTPTDWDNLTDETGVVHETYAGGDRSADRVGTGYSTEYGILATDGFDYWPLDDTSGPMEDAIGSRDMDVTGATLDDSGVINSSGVYFDGSDDYLHVDSAPSVAGFTMNMWAYIPPGNGRQVMFVIEDPDNSELVGLAVWDNDVNKIISYGRTPGSGSTLPTNEWCMLTMVFHTDNTIDAYINGSYDYTSDADDGTWLSGVDLITLGRRTSGTAYYFNGYIDEAMLIDKELSASEIQALYDIGSGGSASTDAVSSTAEADELVVDANLQSDASIDVTVRQGNGSTTSSTNSATVSVSDGTNSYSLSSFDAFADGYYWLDFNFSSSADTAAGNIDSVTLNSSKQQIFVASYDVNGTTYDIPVYDTADVSRSCARFRDGSGNVGAAEIVDGSTAAAKIRHPVDGKLGLKTLQR